MLEGDSAATASAARHLLPQHGVRHFYDPDHGVGRALRAELFPDALEKGRRSLPPDHFLAAAFAARREAGPEWDMYLFFPPAARWEDSLPFPTAWVRQVAQYENDGTLMSVMWVDDYAAPPVEGRLVDELKRALARVTASTSGAPAPDDAIPGKRP